MGKDFSNADKGKTFKQGGDMAKANPFMEMIAKKQMAMPKQSKVNIGKGAKVSPKPEQATAAMKKGGMAKTKKYASGGSVASTVTVNAGKKQSMNYDTKPGKKVSMSAALPRTMKPVKTNPGNINGVAAYGKTKGKTV